MSHKYNDYKIYYNDYKIYLFEMVNCGGSAQHYGFLSYRHCASETLNVQFCCFSGHFTPFYFLFSCWIWMYFQTTVKVLFMPNRAHN